MNEYLEPKFIHAAFIQITATIGLFTHYVQDGTYVAISTLTMAAFAAAHICDKKFNPEQENPNA